MYIYIYWLHFAHKPLYQYIYMYMGHTSPIQALHTYIWIPYICFLLSFGCEYAFIICIYAFVHVASLPSYIILYLSVNIHGFAVLAMLDTGATRSFVSHKLVAKLPATIYTTMPLTVTLPMEKTMVATSVIQLDILADNFIYI